MFQCAEQGHGEQAHATVIQCYSEDKIKARK